MLHSFNKYDRVLCRTTGQAGTITELEFSNSSHKAGETVGVKWDNEFARPQYVHYKTIIHFLDVVLQFTRNPVMEHRFAADTNLKAAAVAYNHGFALDEVTAQDIETIKQEAFIAGAHWKKQNPD